MLAPGAKDLRLRDGLVQGTSLNMDEEGINLWRFGGTLPSESGPTVDLWWQADLSVQVMVP